MDVLLAIILGIIAWSMMKGKPFHVIVEHKYPEVTEIPGMQDPNEEGKTYDVDAFTSAISNLNNIMNGTGGDA